MTSLTARVLTLCFMVTLATRAAAQEAADPLTPTLLEPLPHAQSDDAPVGAQPAAPIAAQPPTSNPATAFPAQAPPFPAPAHSPVATPMPRIEEIPIQALAVSSAPSATISAAGPTFSPPPARSRMGWFGIGARAGVTELRLAPSAGLVARLNSAGTGQTWKANDMSMNLNASTITPTLHFGGSGYFFKIDFPISYGTDFTMTGIGLYPINVGVYIDRLALFPYMSLGGAASIVNSRATADPGTSDKIIGAVVQARASLGVKYFPVRGLALSAEMGYSRWAAGLMLSPPGTSGAAGDNGQTSIRGGVGSVVDFSLGTEWL